MVRKPVKEPGTLAASTGMSIQVKVGSAFNLTDNSLLGNLSVRTTVRGA